MKILNIKKQGSKYKIKLEDSSIIETYDEVIIKNNILYKKEITDELKEKITKENNYYKIYNDVIKYINKKIRSEKEIREYINKKEINNQEKEKIIEDLKQSKLINDSVYAKAYIHDKMCLSNFGINKIKNELIKEGIDENIIEEELNIIDNNELEKLEKLITKKIKTNKKYSEKIMKQKITNEFIKLGYNKEDIENILEKEKIEDNTIIEKEYNKLYNKYKLKLDDEKLKYTIKQKLYQKGFDIEDINQIIN